MMQNFLEIVFEQPGCQSILAFKHFNYNPGQNKLGHWQISVFSSCFLKYRGENIRLEPSHPPSPLIQCWDGRMTFDSTNIETGGAGGTESKTEEVQFCDLSQEF